MVQTIRNKRHYQLYLRNSIFEFRLILLDHITSVSSRSHNLSLLILNNEFKILFFFPLQMAQTFQKTVYKLAVKSSLTSSVQVTASKQKLSDYWGNAVLSHRGANVIVMHVQSCCVVKAMRGSQDLMEVMFLEVAVISMNANPQVRQGTQCPLVWVKSCCVVKVIRGSQDLMEVIFLEAAALSMNGNIQVRQGTWWLRLGPRAVVQ